MENYLLFILIAAAVIASPGPGIVLTLKNTLQYDFRGALPGIAGVALGMLLIAVLSAAGLGLLLTTSALAFTVLKYLGAAYLIYLGIKLWRSSGQVADLSAGRRHSVRKRFSEGLGITALNPKPIVFFYHCFRNLLIRRRLIFRSLLCWR
nr:LysE family translocator [Aliamphritea spongicola]